MNKFTLIVNAIFFSSASLAADVNSTLTGDAKLACEAILCLSTPSMPSACTPSTTRFNNIRGRKLKETVDMRREFLGKCPESAKTPEMNAYADMLGSAGGVCRAIDLNLQLRSNFNRDTWSIDSSQQSIIGGTMPNECQQYYANPWVDRSTTPAYINGSDGGNGGWREQ